MMFEFAEEIERLADIKVVGVGGAGGNAVDRMVAAGLLGVEFLSLNTDLQALQDSRAHHCLQIGAQLTKGLGSGGDPARGRAAAEEDREAIAAALRGADMVFVTAGMGGGTGTGAAPIVADIARQQGALTVGIVTRPFSFEGLVRRNQADEGIARLREAVDTLIIIPNQRLLEVVPPTTSLTEAFRIADNVLYEATRGIYEIISRHDHVNLDFADVRTVMKDMGEAMMGTGRAEGQDRAVAAARAAISSPLLEDVDIAGSQAVLVNLLGREVGLHDTAAAMQFIQEAAGPQAHVIFGFGVDESLGDTLQVTVIATGFQGSGSGAGRFASAQVGQQRPQAIYAAATVEPGAPAARQEDAWREADGQEFVEPESAAGQPAAGRLAWEEPAVDESAVDESADEEFPGHAAACAEPSGEELEFVHGGAAGEPAGEPAGAEDDRMPDWSMPEPVNLTETECQDEPVKARAAAGRPESESESAAEPAPQPRALRAMAAAAGQDAVLDAAARGWEAAEAASSPGTQPFLRRVGTRNIGQVEVPDAPAGAPLGQRKGTDFGPGGGGEDLSAPAYTRKYMD